MHRAGPMALREFTDRTGCRWRVWDIRPEQMAGAARAEDHLQEVIHGWLAFEPAAGGEKRRLSPIPALWEKATEAELERMLERAEPVRTEGGPPARTETPTSPRPAWTTTPPAASPTIRTFRYPNGRYWTVNEQVTEMTTAAGQGPVLRFTSGARALETADWPSDWARMSEDDLVDLLYRSFPREPSTHDPTGLRRRRSDIA